MKKPPLKTNLFLTLLLLLIFGCSSSFDNNGKPLPPKGFMGETTLKIWYFLGFLDLIEKIPEVPANLIKFEDIVYKHTPQADLKLDVYHLKDLDKTRPALVFIHGGGWRGGGKDDYRRYLVDYAEKGYVTVTLSYRLIGKALYPAAVEDVKCAIRWIKKNADTYHIDANKIAVIGGSAGGHLSMMIGYSSDVALFDEECPYNGFDSRVQAVVDLYGPADLTTDYAKNHPTVTGFIGQPFTEAEEKYIQASPSHYITPDDPPTLIFQGTLDALVPFSQSDRLAEKLAENHVPVEYHKLEGWPHTMDLAAEVNAYCQYYMDAFFERYIPITP